MGWVEFEETKTPPTLAERREEKSLAGGEIHKPNEKRRQSDLPPPIPTGGQPRELDLLPRLWLAGHVRERPPWSLGEVFLNRFLCWILACLERPGRHLARKAYLLAVNSVTPHRPINKKLTRQSVFFFNKMNFLIFFFLCI